MTQQEDADGPVQTPEEIYRRFCAAWTSIGQTAGALASGINQAQKNLAENAEAIARAIDHVRKLGREIGTAMIVVRDSWKKDVVPVLRVVKQNADTASRAAEIGSDLASAGWVPSPVEALLNSTDPVAAFEGWTASEWV